MKILITGATGLIGKELGKKLSSHGHTLVAVSRSRKRALLELPFDAEIVEWDAKGTFPVQAFAGVDAVVNLLGENVAEHRWTDEVKANLFHSRVDTTQKLVNAANQAIEAGQCDLKIWIQGSAIGIHGKGFLADLCEAWEKSLSELEASVRRVTLRFGVVFSHKGGAFPKTVVPLLSGVGGVLGSGEQRMALIHLEDVIGFTLYALENKSVEGAYDLVCNRSISQHEVIDLMSNALHVRKGPRVPALALKLVLGEMASVLLEDLPVKSDRVVASGFKFQFPEPEAMVREVCSWHQHPLQPQSSTSIRYEEQLVRGSLEEVIRFYQEAHNLEALTPPWLHFKIASMSTPTITQNTQIAYHLRIHGVPVKWVTDIAIWDPPRRFVDNQLKGPYSLWYHEHRFEEVKGGVLVTDWIRYRLPLGKVGQWVGQTKVQSDVNAILGFRRSKVAELFNGLTIN